MLFTFCSVQVQVHHSRKRGDGPWLGSLCLTITTQPAHCRLGVPRGTGQDPATVVTATALYLAIVTSADIQSSESGKTEIFNQSIPWQPLSSCSFTLFICNEYIGFNSSLSLFGSGWGSAFGHSGFLYTEAARSPPSQSLKLPHGWLRFSGHTAILWPSSVFWLTSMLTHWWVGIKAVCPAPLKGWWGWERMLCARTSAESRITGRGRLPCSGKLPLYYQQKLQVLHREITCCWRWMAT